MSSEIQPIKKPRPRPVDRAEKTGEPPPPTPGLRLLDAAIVVAFLALTFLLGAFPLKDTDFWWHLRTGDLIRAGEGVPKTDIYTFMAEGRPWIDLHWVYQVCISWIYERGGVPALTLAKCAVTTLAVLLLISSRRREWPVWAMATAWLPALLLLGGRMYVRPETMSLLYLAAYLAVLSRLDRMPWLALTLPAVQLAWVNTQGLFVLGPVLLACALVDAVLRPDAFAPGKKRWWTIVGAATLLTGMVCLVNPYGLRGALYPIELARTMRSPIFSQWIAELTPIPEFIRRDGFISIPLRVHFITLILGALSFLAPIVWSVARRLAPSAPVDRGGTSAVATKERGGKGKAKDRPARKGGKARPEAESLGWRLSPFRLLLFAAFSALSMQATRNSHQFAAVVGTITAWNFGEWAAAVRRDRWRRGQLSGDASPLGRELVPRLSALGLVAAVFLWVASGHYYQICGEGRVVGLGEEPLWYPHEAVKFCGTEGMPERSLSYHIGHASLFDYYFGPERKVYVDARLEVIGADLFERYLTLSRRISKNDAGWESELDAAGRPVILADHEGNFSVSAGLLSSPNWKCVWFDPIAAVFVHASSTQVVEKHAIDFAARHFHPDPALEPRGTAPLLAATKGLRNIAAGMTSSARGDQRRGVLLLGMDYARRLIEADPAGKDGWKQLGLCELMRDPPTDSREPLPRFRVRFNPVFDLSPVRATYDLRRALDVDPNDFMSLLTLIDAFQTRSMSEATLPLLDRLLAVSPINGMQTQQQERFRPLRDSLRSSLGPPPPAKWDNVSELNAIVNDLLGAGRAETAAEYLERATPAAARTWEEADRIATLRLHLGQPDKARAIWESVPNPPRPAERDARVGYARLVEGDFGAAREAFAAAAASDPNLFEAQYGLAQLEHDAGRAADSLRAARKAVALAPNDAARSAAQQIVATVTPYANSPIAAE